MFAHTSRKSVDSIRNTSAITDRRAPWSEWWTWRCHSNSWRYPRKRFWRRRAEAGSGSLLDCTKESPRAQPHAKHSVPRSQEYLHRLSTKFVASQGGPKVPTDATVTSTVGIGPRSEGGFGLDIDLAVSLPGVPRAEAA